MSHTTCTQGSRVNSRLLVTGSQTTNSTFDLSFGYNLCFRCPSERAHFRHLCFNRFPKIQESIGTPTPKMGIHLGVWGFIPSHSFAFFCTPESMRCDPWASFLARNLASPYFGGKPKARVVIDLFLLNYIKLKKNEKGWWLQHLCQLPRTKLSSTFGSLKIIG